MRIESLETGPGEVERVKISHGPVVAELKAVRGPKGADDYRWRGRARHKDHPARVRVPWLSECKLVALAPLMSRLERGLRLAGALGAVGDVKAFRRATAARRGELLR